MSSVLSRRVAASKLAGRFSLLVQAPLIVSVLKVLVADVLAIVCYKWRAISSVVASSLGSIWYCIEGFV